MTDTRVQFATALRESRTSLARAVTDQTWRDEPDLETKYGKSGYEKCLQDSGYHLDYLSQAISHSSKILFTDYVRWARVMLAERNVPADDLLKNLKTLSAAIRGTFSDVDSLIADDFIGAGLEQLTDTRNAQIASFIQEDQPLAGTATEFLRALLEGDRRRAGDVIEKELSRGTSIQDLYIHVFQRSQQEVGRLWQTNRISVAHEHFCTAATQNVMAQLYSRIFETPRVGRVFVGTCVGGELHEIGMRMVSDFFEMAGWDSYYLGSNAPTSSVASFVREKSAEVLGISATITFHVEEVKRLIDVVRGTEGAQVRIIVGGYPFNLEPELWKQIGADGCAVDAAGTVGMVERLTVEAGQSRGGSAP